MKKKLGWSTIFYELKGVVKVKIAQNNSQVSEGGITVKAGQDSIHESIIWNVNPFVASVTCSRYQIAFKWSVNFWLQLFSIRWDGKYFNEWNFYLGILQIQENSAGRNFITNSGVYSLLITQAKMQTETNPRANRWRHFGQFEQRKSSVLFPTWSEKSPDSTNVIRQRNVSCPLPVRDITG